MKERKGDRGAVWIRVREGSAPPFRRARDETQTVGRILDSDFRGYRKDFPMVVESGEPAGVFTAENRGTRATCCRGRRETEDRA